MKKVGKIFFQMIGLGGIAAGITVFYRRMKKNIQLTEQKRKKFKSYYEMTNQWILLKNEGKSLEGYFVDNGYKVIAIYGMGEMGNRLYEELNKSQKVKIKYAIDANTEYVYFEELDVVLPDSELESVDAIVVTAIFDFEDIQDKLSEKTVCPIISLEDVVFEC